MTKSPISLRSKGFVLLFALVLVGILVALGIWLEQKYDPFMDSRSEYKEARTLMDKNRKGPLTDEEFARAIALLDCEHETSQLIVLAVIASEAERDPKRKEPAEAAVEKAKRSGNPQFAKVSGVVLKRMQTPSTLPK